MAVLENYKCAKCGYSVYADKHGHYTLMMGECYLFRCTTCKEVVEIIAYTLDKSNNLPVAQIVVPIPKMNYILGIQWRDAALSVKVK